MNSVIPSQCRLCITGNKVTLEDYGTKAKIHIQLSPGKHTKIQVDGCMDAIPAKKCDWCLSLDEKQYAFFELKGSDYCHALLQLGNTIDWFRERMGSSFQLHSSHVVISGRSTPNTKSYKTNAKARFIKKYSRVPQEHKSGKTITLP